MDQLTAACGRSGRLLQLLCQPAEVHGYPEVPEELGLWGIDSGVRHSVAGTDYESVRIGAFMGHRILAEIEGLKCQEDGPRVRIPDDPWRGYLANVTTEQVTRFIGKLPEKMRGHEFLQRYRGTIDTATRVDPDSTYPVRASTLHPIYEHKRIQSFASVLKEAEPDVAVLGRLMYASHESYSRCGLGSPETDYIVESARKAGADAGIHGAKITGGGSGGTVAVLAAREAGDAVRDIASEYAQQQGRQPRIYSGSSPGAAELGCLQLRSTPA
jgi:L-arabinokinase